MHRNYGDTIEVGNLTFSYDHGRENVLVGAYGVEITWDGEVWHARYAGEGYRFEGSKQDTPERAVYWLLEDLVGDGSPHDSQERAFYWLLEDSASDSAAHEHQHCDTLKSGRLMADLEHLSHALDILRI